MKKSITLSSCTALALILSVSMATGCSATTDRKSVV